MAKESKISPDINNLVSAIVGLLMRWGLPYRESLIYAHLLLNPKKELNISELSRLTGLSQSSISYSLKYLRNNHYIKLSRKAGRTKYYIAEPSFYRTFIQQPIEVLNTYLLPIIEMIKALEKKTSKDKDYKSKIETLHKDLQKLKCTLERVIEVENKDLCFQD